MNQAHLIGLAVDVSPVAMSTLAQGLYVPPDGFLHLPNGRENLPIPYLKEIALKD
jgi:hypothetical protein